MIRKYSTGSLLALLLVAGGAAAAELKIGVLDLQQAIMASEEAQQFMQAAQSELKPDQDEVNALQDEIRRLQEALQKDAEVMSPAEQRRRQKELEDKQIDYRYRVNRLQKEIQDRQQELMNQMGPKLEAAIKDLVESEDYDLILQRADLIYAKAEHSITEQVTEKLNEKRDASR
ncbi:MAG TPA: OmpH family outer membrane protein [Pseudomonadales bacterium]